MSTDQISFKALNGQINIDEAQGIVECFVAAVGNKDSVGDVVATGAFTESLKRRKPRVVWGHSWNDPIGKVLEIYEVPTSDPRLPVKMKQAGVGGLFAKVQFNLATEKGREAFASVAFFGQEQEWCADDQTEILTDRGWLRYDEVTVNDLAYVLDTELGWGRFEPIEAINVHPAKERQMRHIEVGGHSSLTTAAHRWPLLSNIDGGKVQWTTTEKLRPQDKIIRSAPRFDAPVTQKYSDAFVELVGWFWTEGWIAPDDHSDSGVYVAQSLRVNPQHVASIRAALEIEFSGMWSERHSTDEMARFRIKREAAQTILGVTGVDKEPTVDFLFSLTRAQLVLLTQICLNGDGHVSKTGQKTWYQVAKNGIRAFEMLCALVGQPTNTKSQKDYGNRFGRPPSRVSLLKYNVSKPLDAIRVKLYGYKKGTSRTKAIDEWVTTTGIVWCPTTLSGTWLARRNGSVYFTGNSIGYKTLNATFDPGSQANVLHEVELYEVSPVLHGANQLTGTISVKSDDGEKGHGMMMRMPEMPSGPAIVGRPVLSAIVRQVSAPAPQRQYEREDIFEEGEARVLPDEARNLLAMELMSRSRLPLDIIHATENSIIFNRDAGKGNSITYRLSYHREEGTNEYMFGKPEKIGMRNQESTIPSGPAVVPSQMPSMSMSVKPGYGMPTGMTFLSSDGKSLDEALDKAADLIIDAATSDGPSLPADKLQYAIELLQGIGGLKQEPMEEEVFTVLCSPDEAYQVKSLLDPIIEYHRLDAEVDNQGIHISNGLTQEAIIALENIALTIDDVLYGEAGGSKK